MLRAYNLIREIICMDTEYRQISILPDDNKIVGLGLRRECIPEDGGGGDRKLDAATTGTETM